MPIAAGLAVSEVPGGQKGRSGPCHPSSAALWFHWSISIALLLASVASAVANDIQTPFP
jgi:hypothetical protein